MPGAAALKNGGEGEKTGGFGMIWADFGVFLICEHLDDGRFDPFLGDISLCFA